MVFLVVVLLIFITSIGLSLWVGEMLGKTYYGFFIVAGVYMLVALILYAGRNQLIKHPVKNAVITHLQKKK